MKKTIFALLATITLATAMVSCTKDEADDVIDEIRVVRSESDTHGFQPSGMTDIIGLYVLDTTVKSWAMVSRTINTNTYSDGHIETDTTPTIFVLRMSELCQFEVDELAYSADSSSATGQGVFYMLDTADVRHPGQLSLYLKENGAPQEAKVRVDYNGRNVDLHFYR